MNLSEILLNSSGALLLLLTLVEITPLKINPWSTFAKHIGKAFNHSVLVRLDELEKQIKSTENKLDGHIDKDAKDKAEEARALVLRFNNELLRNIPHTREEYFDVLQSIDTYEDYCDTHKDYENNRAVFAIANIKRSYDARLIKHDFLEEQVAEKKEGI